MYWRGERLFRIWLSPGFKKEEKKGLSECSEEFERVAAFQVWVGEPLGYGAIQSLSGEFSAEYPCCSVRLVFEPEGLDSEPEDEAGEHEGEGSDEFGQIPFYVSGHGCLFVLVVVVFHCVADEVS